MDFVEKIVENFGPGGQRTEYVEERRDYYEGPPQPEGPPLPRPWISQWSEQDRRWYYLNEATGERSWERPYGGPPGGGYGGPPGGGYGQGGYGGAPPSGEYYREEVRYDEQPKKDHSMAYGIGGAALGLAGGALLMHEGEKIRMSIVQLPVLIDG